MIALLQRLSEDERGRLKREDPPEQPEPMLAVLSDAPFSDPDWIFERKLDGERALAVHDGDRIRLVSPNGESLADSYPEILEALRDDWTAVPDEPGDAELPTFVVDGEVVAFSGSVTSFSRLQERMHVHDADEARRSAVAVYYYLFDLLHLDGHDLGALPLRTRKGLLKDALAFSDPIRYTLHHREDGQRLHDEACSKGWEGVVAKRAGAPYRHARSRDWLKFKCVNRQELVVGGFTEPGGSRTGFGALLVGYYEDGALRYAGKVGTGFDDDTLERLARLLRSRERKTPPFARVDQLPPDDGVHWVTPNLVGQFGFTEWTRTGKLRHPRFLGLRRDKAPRDVRREEPDTP